MVNDYDLEACLESNYQKSFVFTDIAEVLAVWEGQNDGDDWRWVLKLNDGRFFFLQGGCDYTGWDCQSWAMSQAAESAEAAANLATGEDLKLVEGQKTPYDAGLGHMLNMLSGSYTDNFETVRDSLLRQVREGKDKTWRETKGQELLGG